MITPDPNDAARNTVTLQCRTVDGRTITGVPRPFAPASTLAQSQADLIAATATCDARFPQASAASRLLPDPIPSSCFRGSLGAEAYALRSLAYDVASARAELDEQFDEYKIAMESCALLQRGNDALQTEMESFNSQVGALEDARQGWDTAATIASASADCLDSITGAADTDLSTPIKVTLAAGSCAARGIAAAAESASRALENDIGRLERGHDVAMFGIQSSTDEDRCFKEAELALVGIESSVLRMRQAVDALAAGHLQLDHDIESGRQAKKNGRANIDWAGEILIRVAGRDPWLEQDVTRFERKMRLARRAVYLGVRAVEYEFQTSLGVRADALAAETPDELDAVIDVLRQVKLTGSVNGARPSELTELVSLKQHILQLGDRVDVSEGELALSADERFKKLLTDPRFQVYEDGEFAGVEIPFALAPLAAFDRGNPVGVSLVNASSCAERLWALNATVVGDESRMYQGLNPVLDFEVRQRNTFYANNCADGPERFQVASTRPAKNLFAEPGSGFAADVARLDDPGFAKARIQARFNVSPAELTDASYVNGESTELAARLLFGEYSIFIPASSLAEVGPDGAASGDGLRLNEVDDIILRIDHVSVAR